MKKPAQELAKLCNAINIAMMEEYNLPFVRDINEGYCFVWARIFKRFVPKAKYYNVSYHAAIKYNNTYWDAECWGIEDVWQLPTVVDNYNEYGDKARYTQTDEEFFRYWTAETVREPNKYYLKDAERLDKICERVEALIK